MFGKTLGEKTAPEFSGLKGWLNSPPLTLANLRGKAILLDFWTYSCVNCIRTLPHMRHIHEQYSGDSFIIIGVHTPEFQFEKIPENVADAVKRFDIQYPVAIDSDNVTWKLYGNQYWPRQTLLDAKGRIRWEHAGEGDYETMEDQIRSLLRERGKQHPILNKGAQAAKSKESENPRLTTITPEIYTGSLRSRGFGNGQVCVPGSCTRFLDPGDHERDTLYLEGDWTQFPEYVIHTGNESGYVLLRFSARNANAVLGTLNKKPLRVGIELDERAVDKGQGGGDARWDAEGSFVHVKDHRLYDIVRTGDQEAHELKLKTSDDGLCLYTYTFG